MPAIGLSAADLDDAAGWIPVEALTRAWTLVPALCGDPDFGLHAAESAPTGVYGMLEFVVMSSPTVYEALDRIARMYHLVGGMSEVSLVADGASVRVIHRTTVAVEANRLRHYSEHFLAMIVSRGRAMAAADVKPRAVCFEHEAPVSIEEHARIFRAPIFFGQPQNELVVDKAALDVPLRMPPMQSGVSLAGSGAAADRHIAAAGAADRVAAAGAADHLAAGAGVAIAPIVPPAPPSSRAARRRQSPIGKR